MAIEAVERSPDIFHFPHLKISPFKKETLFKPKLRIGSLENKEDLQEAGKMIENGEVVIAQLRNVFGIWAKGDSDKALDKAIEIKGETNKKKPFSSMMFSQDFVALIDLEVVSEPFRSLLDNPRVLQTIIGGLCHLRAPIKPSLVSKIPERMLTFNEEDGRYYMHNFDPFGHKISRLIKEFNQRGIKHVAVTSFNNHSKNEAEITNLPRAEEFCRGGGVKLLLTDPSPKREEVKGSFAIVNIRDLSASRTGNVPVEVLEEILGIKFDKSKMKEAAYLKSTYPSLADFEGFPELRRAAIILSLKNFSDDEIANRLQKVKNFLMAKKKN